MLDFPWYLIFTLATPWFWLLSIAAGCIIISALENENGTGATGTLVAFIILMLLFGPALEWGKYVIANPITILWYVVGYIWLGAIWGIVKWYFYLVNDKNAYEACKLKWLSERKINDTKEIPPTLKKEWLEYVCGHTKWGTTRMGKEDRELVLLIPLKAWNHKSKIISWMCYWPLSLLWSLIDDLVKNIFDFVYRKLGSMLNKISERVWRDAKIDCDFQDEENKNDN